MARRNESSKKDIEFNKALYSAVRSLGWLLPETEAEVAETEEQGDSAACETPSELSNPLEALDRAPDFSLRPTRGAPADPDYVIELSRAARAGGGELPSDVEEKMRRDRKRAEGRSTNEE